MIARPAEFFRIDIALHDGTTGCVFAESFAEAISVACTTAHVARPAPKVFQVDPTTYAEIKQREWLS